VAQAFPSLGLQTRLSDRVWTQTWDAFPEGPFPVAQQSSLARGRRVPTPNANTRPTMSDTNIQLLLLCSAGSFLLLVHFGRRIRLHVGRRGLSLTWERGRISR
jgi:hypothetical protein